MHPHRLQVTLLNAEHNPDLMLFAARALTFLADVLPSSCASIIRHGAVPAFCARLLAIEYIDLAEQSLQALEKISHEHPASCLRSGGLVAVLSYIDFFQTGVQRVAVQAAANICRGLTLDGMSAASTAAPILINLLQYQARQCLIHACWLPQSFPDTIVSTLLLFLLLSGRQSVGQRLPGALTNR